MIPVLKITAEEKAMMGQQSTQEDLFYEFRLEDHVPGDHLLRQLDAVLNFERVRSTLAGHYSPTGRPSIDPEMMLRMLLIGYAYGIRSERLLCSEVHLNLAYRWFCVWVWKELCRIIRPFPRTAMAGFAKVIFTGCCSKMSSVSAGVRDWLVARVSPWIAA